MTLEGLTPTQREGLLRAIERTIVFGVLDPQVRAALLSHFELRQLAGADTLFRRGDPADALYVLCAGSLGVFGPGASSEQERLLGF
jgi:CRP-like cAMP-binding protein